MAKRVGTMVQPNTGLTADIYEGFSWPCFFFGAFWYLYKGMWGIGLLWVALAIVTGSVLHWLGILVIPFFANRQYLEHLGNRGWQIQADRP